MQDVIYGMHFYFANFRARNAHTIFPPLIKGAMNQSQSWVSWWESYIIIFMDELSTLFLMDDNRRLFSIASFI